MNSKKPTWHYLLKLMRPKQWVKNAFVLSPLIFSGTFLYTEYALNALIATILFCIASSATYILNDYMDIESDKKHPKKSKTRPLASGDVSKNQARILMACLYSTLIIASFFVPKVMSVILGYLLLNVAYTFYLKHQPVLDIFTIASGFVLRVYAGAVALDVPLSSWMFITTLCLALYLGSIKRKQELTQSGKQGRKVLKNYTPALVDKYAEMSSTGALLFYSLFVVSSKPAMIITIPFVLFGLFRYWYVVESLDGGESPTDALFADIPLQIAILAWVGTCLWSLWPATGV